MLNVIVTCAIIENENQVLVVQRSEYMKLPLKWEFPGGKIEKWETDEDCIKREIREELNLEIELIKKLTPAIYDYPEVCIELIPFIAKQIGGQLKLNEHADFKYLTKAELLNLDWAEADVSIVKEYLGL
ncbi:8-oxo-dGTP diphosphatase [Spirosomataceae bacterium TFI 002]|nr:8-oxo-dGTP diphosphatase [Spirosomataceae bacterium TFI 002]